MPPRDFLLTASEIKDQMDKQQWHSAPHESLRPRSLLAKSPVPLWNRLPSPSSNNKVSNHCTKKFYHEQVSVAIWDVEDEPEHPFFLANKAKYTQAVNSRIDNLHKEYKKHAKTLSQTGIGLDKIEITIGLEIANQIDAILEDFPWWHDLNPIWCELPKYNVLTTSNSTADGQELATHLDGILNSLSEKGGAVVEGNSEDNSQLLDLPLDTSAASTSPIGSSPPPSSPLVLLSDLDETKYVPSEASTPTLSTLTQPTWAARFHTPLPSVSTPLSRSAQPTQKGKCDALSEFHEQSCLEFEQTHWESEQLHEQLLVQEQWRTLHATQKHVRAHPD
ncbi:uncharacterized protein EI90DRAFT_3139847 [Cantharellus anzutake]|uniref:uncharacterized protein n=1 Tax=Cantharellus anzutake TaxID=1750568 RepID=UPI0019063A91|nr:uncharacterized protein EI90DRAFT_3139847 [Cantharellus anzutake]KAF8310228.1 hypothetical protein EI90DRAFT_3139847 [Cantharellus anzutake]